MKVIGFSAILLAGTSASFAADDVPSPFRIEGSVRAEYLIQPSSDVFSLNTDVLIAWESPSPAAYPLGFELGYQRLQFDNIDVPYHDDTWWGGLTVQLDGHTQLLLGAPRSAVDDFAIPANFASSTYLVYPWRSFGSTSVRQDLMQDGIGYGARIDGAFAEVDYAVAYQVFPDAPERNNLTVGWHRDLGYVQGFFGIEYFPKGIVSDPRANEKSRIGYYARLEFGNEKLGGEAFYMHHAFIAPSYYGANLHYRPFDKLTLGASVMDNSDTSFTPLYALEARYDILNGFYVGAAASTRSGAPEPSYNLFAGWDFHYD